ncbi:bifunctional acetate--CoA ligase family protein/GNAT family N-acetyltransferase [Streptomyces flavofungini]|uniref:bifunctional acetate--CoA ligase family protein/GNAT family N-acetyltransferase n=1 Tax=Streptomyces flavofungini TaxID=68200 RepID=UPI0025AF9A23|nr:bifunctional GNAT family N-acetyltransferase/acetate--CoA ligase family protein [Streptomyces flavofungini]WJV45695.1 GNAT family N-acetyltransferase [Streptomyces flavofungini]
MQTPADGPAHTSSDSAAPAPADQHPYPSHWEADVVLRDGGTARIRPITAADADRLVSFFEQVSDESKYYRFFAPYPRLSAKDVRRFTHHDHVDRVGLAATVGGEFIATVRFDRIDAQGRPASAPAHPSPPTTHAGGRSAPAPFETAEVAFLVQDAHQGRGVASALLEHIAAVARERGIRRFAAEVLPANTKMVKVFTDAGYQQRRSFEDGVVRLELDLEPTDRSLAVQRAREQRAEARSVQRLLAPGSVAVIGVGRSPDGVGRGILRNVLGAGFTGRLYAVNSALPEGATDIDGVPAHRSVRDIADPVDLAVVAVPAERVPQAVADCGEHGVQGLVVISAGYAESGPEGRERQRELVRQARSYGMRIIGPNAFGVINTSPETRLNASLAPDLPPAGRLGLFTQSGAIGIALLSRLHRRGSGLWGLSTCVSTGNRADVSGNDVLQYWYDDPDTDVALMYLESIGNPRKFTRLARRTAAVKPLVVVQGARHSGIAPTGHAGAATRLPHATVSALLRQAGVIRVDTVTELVDAGLLLAGQPLPAGPRVAILGNSESLGLLTYDACVAEGLRPLPPLDLTTSASPDDFRTALAAALADEGCDAVVVTVIPSLGEAGRKGEDESLATALRAAAASCPTKPVTVVHVELGGLAKALSAAASTGPRAAAVTEQGDQVHPVGSGHQGDTGRARGSSPQGDAARAAGPGHLSGPARPEDTAHPAGPAHPTDLAHPAAPTAPTPPPAPPRPQAGPGAPPPRADRPGPTPRADPPPHHRIPAYPAAERAVRALAEAVKYAQWRRDIAEPGKVPEYDDIDEQGAGELIERLLAKADDVRGVTLDADDAHDLLARYGIGVRRALAAPDADTAVRAAREAGYPVALKTTAPHLRHRPDLGGVRLDLADEEQLRRAYRELTHTLGRPAELRPVVQAMVARGVDTVVRAGHDPVAGAVLSFGLAGAASELLGDTAHRLIPVTDREAGNLVRSIRTAPLLFGWRGSAPVDTPALEELLMRLSRLVDDHPEVVTVSLEPVVVAQEGLSVLSATVRLAPPPARDDLGPRTLPAY